MGRHQNKNLIAATLVIFTVIACSVYEVKGARLLEVEKQQWLKQKVDVLSLRQTLQRGPVPPSGRSPCTYIPGQSSGSCTLGQKNYAVHQHNSLSSPPPPLPSYSSAGQR
ncbi:hypothetical protein QQ045_027665 [Rhodiola kirilowii]